MNEITLERVDEEQEYDETEDDSYMGDNGSDDVDIEPQSPPWWSLHLLLIRFAIHNDLSSY